MSRNSTSHTISQLTPYQQYTIQVEACTAAGCTLSSESHSIRTPPAPPEDVPAPQLYSDTPTSVLLSWAPPRHANGELDGYIIERRVIGTQQISTVATFQPNQTLTYLDSSATLSPWTTYEYRNVAHTRLGGSNSSEWEKVTTRPSRPAGLQPPHVQVLGPASVQVHGKSVYVLLKGIVHQKLNILTLKPSYVYMTFFFQRSTVWVILKNVLALPRFIMAVNGGQDFEA